MTWTYVMEKAAQPDGRITSVYPLVSTSPSRALVKESMPSQANAHPWLVRCSAALLKGRTLTCSCHDWRFDIRTGHSIDALQWPLQ
jgi:hypothetical protein